VQEAGAQTTPAVLVVGEALVDVFTEPDSDTNPDTNTGTNAGAVVTRPGGGPANVAVALARLGQRTVLATNLGADEHGAVVMAHLEGSGVAVVVMETARTSTATVTLDGRLDASYEFAVTWEPDAATLHAAARDAGWLHVGSLGAQLAPGARTVLELVQEVHGRMPVSFDPNCRPTLLAPRRDWLERFVALSTVVTLSEDDARAISPGEEPVALARAWAGLGPRLVVLTRGADGAVAVAGAGAEAGRRELREPACAADVVDTVGAGDAFMAGLIYTQLRGDTPEGSIRFASRVAARTCERAGAEPPTRSDL
jgi:fructokinase